MQKSPLPSPRSEQNPEAMPTRPTVKEVRQSLNAHVAMKGMEIAAKYGVAMKWKTLGQLLLDRTSVRYPCTVEFDATHLLPGEMAHAIAQGEAPEAGFVIHVHPWFMMQLDLVPALVLYQLVLVNYGEFATTEDAEVFGANALGMPREAYYELLCTAADQLPQIRTNK